MSFRPFPVDWVYTQTVACARSDYATDSRWLQGRVCRYHILAARTGLLESFAGPCHPSPRVQLGLQAHVRPGEWSAANQGRKISLAVRGLSFWLDLGVCLFLRVLVLWRVVPITW